MKIDRDPRRVFHAHDVYRKMSPQETGLRLDIPDVVGHMLYYTWPRSMLDQQDWPTLVFTWMRPEKLSTLTHVMRGLPATYDMWKEEGTALWIVDMAASNMTGVQVGRMLGAILIDEELVEEGELVLYRRNSGALPGRFGKAIARSEHGKVWKRENPQRENPRPMHAEH